MKSKGFTLIELLAVIVILGVIMVIAGTSVMGSIRDTKKKARFMAAKDIVEIASTYLAEKGGDSVNVKDLCNEGYIEKDATNPADENAKNISSCGDFTNQNVVKGDFSLQDNYDIQDDCYDFDGYKYCFK